MASIKRAIDGDLFITQAGNVGIGTDTPTYKLQVAGAGRFSNNQAGGASVSTNNSDATDDAAISNLNFDGNRLRLGVLASDSAYGAVGSNGGTTGLAFITHDGSSWGERMRLVPAGRLLIGKTTDSGAPFNLQVDGRIMQTGTEFLFEGDNDKRITVYSARPLIFATTDVERMRITSTGNVGIGTTNPTFSAVSGNTVKGLHIQNIGNDTQASLRLTGHNNTGSPGQATYTEFKHAGGNLRFDIDHNGTTALTVGPTGNVGVGITSPGAKLDVWGDLRVSGSVNEQLVLDFAASTGNYTYQSFRLNGTNKYRIFGYTSGDFALYSDVASQYPLYINAGGNVGIGNSSPLVKLHVTGDVMLTKTTTAQANFGGPVISLGDSTSEVGMCGGIAFAELLTGDADNVSMGLYYDGKANKLHVTGPRDDQATTGENLISATKHLTILRDNGSIGIGTTNPASTLQVNGNFRLYTTNSDSNELRGIFNVGGAADPLSFAMYKADATTVGAYLTADGASYFVGGNVGIGTTNPNGKLHVYSSATTGGIRVGGGNGTGNSRVFIEAAGENNYIDSYGDSAYKPLSIEASILKLNVSSGGSVGIGTGSPVQKLHVSGFVRANGVQVSDSTVTAFIGQQKSWLGTGTSNNLVIASETGFATNFYTDGTGTLKMTITSAGNVGIGYESPAYRLQVLNDIGLRANSQNFQAIKGTGWGYSPGSYKVVMLGDSNPSNFTTVSIGYDPSGNANGAFSGDGREVLFRRGAKFVTPNSADNSFFLNNLVLQDGYVGIGTDAPATTLDVNGNAVFRVSDSSNTTGGFTITNDGSSTTAAPWSFNSNPIMLVTSDNAGNPHIGINQSSNTTDPARIIGYKSRGTSAANANVANGDEIFNLQAWALHTAGPNVYKFGGDMTWYKDDNGGTASTYAPMSLRWRTANSTTTVLTAMTLLYNGNLGVGSTAPAYLLDVAGTIRATGDVIAYSDARVKENVLTLENSLELVKKLRGVSYNKIGETEKKVGVIAQEVLQVLPEVVSQDSEGTYSVAYGNITAVLIEAIKQQQLQIDELKAEIKQLKG